MSRRRRRRRKQKLELSPAAKYIKKTLLPSTEDKIRKHRKEIEKYKKKIQEKQLKAEVTKIRQIQRDKSKIYKGYVKTKTKAKGIWQMFRKPPKGSLFKY